MLDAEREDRHNEEVSRRVQSRTHELIEDGEEVNNARVSNSGYLIWYDDDGQKHFTKL